LLTNSSTQKICQNYFKTGSKKANSNLTVIENYYESPGQRIFWKTFKSRALQSALDIRSEDLHERPFISQKLLLKSRCICTVCISIFGLPATYVTILPYSDTSLLQIQNKSVAKNGRLCIGYNKAEAILLFLWEDFEFDFDSRESHFQYQVKMERLMVSVTMSEQLLEKNLIVLTDQYLQELYVNQEQECLVVDFEEGKELKMFLSMHEDDNWLAIFNSVNYNSSRMTIYEIPSDLDFLTNYLAEKIERHGYTLVQNFQPINQS